MDTPPIQNNYAYIILEVVKIRETHQNLSFLKKTPVNTEESPSRQSLSRYEVYCHERTRNQLGRCSRCNHESLFLRLVKEYAEREGVTEQLKAENPTEWVQKMNNIRNRAAETVCADLIFT